MSKFTVCILRRPTVAGALSAVAMLRRTGRYTPQYAQ